MLSSYQARIIDIRQVTQLNDANNTAGIDGKLALTNAEKFELEKKFSQEAKRLQHQALGQTHIVKSNGTKQTLKIPTIAARAWQCLIQRILQRAPEAHLHEKIYRFRSGTGTYDAPKYLFNSLRRNCNGQNKKIIQLNIEKRFNRINHSSFLDQMIAPQSIKHGLRQ